MRLHNVSVRAGAATVRLVADVESDSQPGAFELYFEFPIEFESFVSLSADPFAVALLIPAMLRGEPLHISPPVSPRLLFQLPRIRDILHTWHPRMARSDIQATPGTVDPAPLPNRAATFFSGGVDSFYTLLKFLGPETLPAPLTHMIFMRGLEKPLDFLRGVEASQELVQAIARAAGVQCIVGESNLRTHFDADWLYLYCGSGLAATALSLAGGFSHVCIPSTHSYRNPVVIGTTPLVDERYSTERVQVVHDGSELGRPDKLARILEWDRDLVLKHLRVCVMNFGGVYNCCECRKCVRTMVVLRALGLLEQAPTFPNKSTKHWAGLVSLDSLPLVEENLAFVRARAGDPALTALLERIVRRRRRKEGLRALLLNSPFHAALPAIVDARRRVHDFRERMKASRA
jgi:hypothetical protein